MRGHFLSSEIANAPANNARFHIIPAPLEKTVSYGGGTRMGPDAILKASDQLELVSRGTEPHRAGIHTQDPIDPDLSSGEFLKELEVRADSALAAGAVPVTLGGEHAVSFAPIAACAARLGAPLGVIQFDAHADLRTAYQGDRFSHASVMQRAVDELGVSLFQIGVRAVSREEEEFRVRHGIRHLDGPDLHRKLRQKGRVDILEEIGPDFPEHIYITFDVDGFDASFLPATGTPVPGGLFWPETMEMLEDLAGAFTIAGCDVVELAPIETLPYCSFTAAQLVYDLLGYVLVSRQRSGGRDS